MEAEMSEISDGRRFEGRDHTTAPHAVRKIESPIGTGNSLAAEIEVLESQLQEVTGYLMAL